MHLQIDGQDHEFIDLKTFQSQHGLDADFGVATFEPKDTTGLGQIDGAGPEMNTLFTRTLAHLPDNLSLMAWLDFIPSLQAHFSDELEAINPRIGLRPPEIEFAVAGLGDVCRAVIYALIYAHAQQSEPPDFDHIYRNWLYSTVRMAATTHPYEHHDTQWTAQVISHAYGRIGLRIDTGAAHHYVLDHRLACPAENFMERLLRKITEHILS